jgi:hypothetical protein
MRASVSLEEPTPRVPTRETRLRPDLAWVGASLLIVVLTPVILHEAFRWEHSLGYRGSCRARAPDMTAFPCSYAEYMAEFGDSRLLFIEAGAFFLVLLVVSALWVLAWWRAGSSGQTGTLTAE